MKFFINFDKDIDKPIVYEDKDDYGNYEKLTKYKNGYEYESFFHNN